MAPKKNNNYTASSDTAQESNNNNNYYSSQQRQNQNTNNSQGTKASSQRAGGDAPQSTPIRRSKRAGVVFPVDRIRRVLQGRNTSKLVFNTTAVYMAGVLEYLVAEVAELAGNAANDNKRKRITPRHIFLAIRNDEELNKVCDHVTIAEGGVMPNIHQILLQSKNNNNSTQSLKGDTSHQQKKKSNSQKQANTSATDEADSADDDDDTMQS